MDFSKSIVTALKKKVKGDIVLEVPPNPEWGDYAFACFRLASEQKKKPHEAALELSSELDIKGMSVDAKGPYVNFFLDRTGIAQDVLKAVSSDKNFGQLHQKGTIVIDYSQPNVAKHMGVHNMRSTVIGGSLYRIYSFAGHKTIGVNYIGDWGTNFGQLIIAAQKWSSPTKIKKDGVKELNRIYVKFHEEAEKDPVLQEIARAAFKDLEDGDKKSVELWELFKEVSLKDYKRIYDMIGVTFDSFDGEAIAVKDVPKTIKLLEKERIVKKDDGALIVDFKDVMPPCLILKSDGASTYAARDIAAFLTRLKKYKPKKVLYVVDIAQKLHFEQVFGSLKKLDKKYADIGEHIIFGRMRFPDKSMSTRKGNIIIFEDVLNKAIGKVEKIIAEKNPHLKNKKEVARQVGIGAIIFNDLFSDRINNITFEWDRILDFEGDTGPYIQYAYARCSSILRKYGKPVHTKVVYELLTEDAETALIKLLGNFDDIIAEAISRNRPSVVARYTMDLARTFNSFYRCCPVVGDDIDVTHARVLLVSCTKQVLGKALELLLMEHPEEM